GHRRTVGRELQAVHFRGPAELLNGEYNQFGKDRQSSFHQKSTSGVSGISFSNSIQNGCGWVSRYQVSNPASAPRTSGGGASSSTTGARPTNTCCATGTKRESTSVRASLSSHQPSFARMAAVA